jgi:hypothetical protein
VGERLTMISRRFFLMKLSAVPAASAASAVSRLTTRERAVFHRASSAGPGLGDLFDDFLNDLRGGRLEALRRAIDAQPALIFAHDANDVSAFRLAARHAEATVLLQSKGYTPDLLDLVTIGDRDRTLVVLKSTPYAVAQRSHTGETALHAAAATGQSGIVKDLVHAGADVNAAEWRLGETPMLTAFRRAPTAPLDEIMVALIDAGANVTTASRDGTTPLHGASARRRPVLVELLIRKGARLDAKDQNGLTPADISRDRGHTELMDLLTGRRRVAP